MPNNTRKFISSVSSIGVKAAGQKLFGILTRSGAGPSKCKRDLRSGAGLILAARIQRGNRDV